jgi:hypothetical protein
MLRYARAEITYREVYMGTGTRVGNKKRPFPGVLVDCGNGLYQP